MIVCKLKIKSMEDKCVLFDNVGSGDRLEIRLVREKNQSKYHLSQVEKVLPDLKVVVSAPIAGGEVVKLPKMEKYSLLFFTEKGMLSFTASFVNVEEEDGFYYTVFHIDSEGERIQRREFFRFDCVIPFNFNFMTDKDYLDFNELRKEPKTDDKVAMLDDLILKNKNNAELDGVIKDIGVGGMRFVSNNELEAQNVISCVIKFDKDDNADNGENVSVFFTAGKILHKQAFPKAAYRFQYRVQFNGLTPKEQERITQFIFNEQKKGLANIK